LARVPQPTNVAPVLAKLPVFAASAPPPGGIEVLAGTVPEVGEFELYVTVEFHCANKVLAPDGG
jgi:hypothetical protein